MLRKFVMRTTYRRDIILVLCMKIILLICLWGLFFSHPVKRDLTSDSMAVRILE